MSLPVNAGALPPASADAGPPALAGRGLTRRFGTITALERVDFTVAPGSIHALLGENGAGKSTLLNLLSGLQRPDEGTLNVFGQPARFGSPLGATAAGIGMVHQHFLLAGALSVTENIALGLRRSPLGLHFGRASAEDCVAALSAETGLAIDPRARVDTLSVGARQRVEILKALYRGARILLLDEPTAVLAPPEVEPLFATLRALQRQGRTLVIVTHKLDEVFALASAATVLRRGRQVFEGPLASVTPAQLASHMIGSASASIATPEPMALAAAASAASTGQPAVLELSALHAAPNLRVPELRVHAGEIVGIAGVEGNGQEALARVLTGLQTPASGTLSLGGTPLAPLSIALRRAAGLRVIPADRQRDGLVLEFTLAENIALDDPPLRRHAGLRWLDRTALRQRAERALAWAGVRPPDPEYPAAALSGGNQQKVVLARELQTPPKLLVACNPTRGLDLGATAEIHAHLLHAARGHGSAILLISSDLDEILALSDRLCVMKNGLLRELGPRGVSREALGAAMVGAPLTGAPMVGGAPGGAEAPA